MPEPENILAQPPETCSPERRAGFARGGNGERALRAIGSHTVCDPVDLS